MEITKIQIQGMTCSACEKLIGNRLRRIPEVQTAEVSLDKQQAIIQAPRKITKEEIHQTLHGTKYAVAVLD